MKIIQINATCGMGSTGKICTAISSILTNNNIENYILYSTGKSDYPFGLRYMSDPEVKIGALESRILGNYGFDSSGATKRMVRKLKEINPDIIHLHNIHGHNCDLSILFDYLRRSEKKIVWTFHDCWAFTGSCTHFSYVECDKWKTKCCNCLKHTNLAGF